MKLTIHPLTPARWPGLEARSNARGCSVARGCWCMHCRESGKADAPADTVRAPARRARLQALSDKAKGVLPGLVACRGQRPVGWIPLGPREDRAKLKRSPAMKPLVDGMPARPIVRLHVPRPGRSQPV